MFKTILQTAQNAFSEWNLSPETRIWFFFKRNQQVFTARRHASIMSSPDNRWLKAVIKVAMKTLKPQWLLLGQICWHCILPLNNAPDQCGQLSLTYPFMRVPCILSVGYKYDYHGHPQKGARGEAHEWSISTILAKIFDQYCAISRKRYTRQKHS